MSSHFGIFGSISSVGGHVPKSFNLESIKVGEYGAAYEEHFSQGFGSAIHSFLSLWDLGVEG